MYALKSTFCLLKIVIYIFRENRFQAQQILGVFGRFGWRFLRIKSIRYNRVMFDGS